MGNHLGGRHWHHLDFMHAVLNKPCVLATACGLCAPETTASHLESQLESGTRGQSELATVQGRGFVQWDFVKNAVLHNKGKPQQ